jgi:uncharacterized protein (TIGR02145 family)
MEKGVHQFQFFPGGEKAYILNFTAGGNSQTVKLLNTGSGGNDCRLICQFSDDMVQKTEKKGQARGFIFTPGDELLLVGYAGSLESGIILFPTISQEVIFQFTYGIPCPGTPSVSHRGRLYNTVQIFSQCWFKENMNDGELIPGAQNMTNNGKVEKYCFADLEFNCDVFGGLYQWDEVMQYVRTPGIQGICPDGWHIPTDAEWMILEGVADSAYGIGDPIWEQWNFRGTNAGKNLKSTIFWELFGAGTDKYGFSAIPAGLRNDFLNFLHQGYFAWIWSSTEENEGWARYHALNYDSDAIGRLAANPKTYGFSLRCLRN